LLGAHLVELQHECLHGHAFRSPALNRVFGVICGLFMMSSYSHYRYDHLRHHAYLGTEKNLEHFNYRFSNLDSIWGFARAFFDLSRFKRVFGIACRGLIGASVPGIGKDNYARAVKQEYLLFVAILLATVAYSVVTGSWFFALAWWLPALLVSEGVHFMIEMPEHFGLNTQSDPDVLTNCRTIQTSKSVQWFVNGNDVHTAHHYHHGVPMCNVRTLHEMIKPKIGVVESSYRSFYWAVIRGQIKHDLAVSCMER
jgi:fatty acid desaturase